VSYETTDDSWSIASESDKNRGGFKRGSDGKVNVFLDDEEKELSKFVVLPSTGRSKSDALDVVRLSFKGDTIEEFADSFETKRLKVYTVVSPESTATANEISASVGGSGGGGCLLRF